MASPRSTKRRVAPLARGRVKAAARDESALWIVHEGTALAALDFWNGFLILRMGAAGDKPLDAAARQRLAAIVRAVSWVESKHGTATTNQGRRDPMQCGHPQDAWWRQVTSAGRPGQDRFITGPGGTNFWAERGAEDRQPVVDAIAALLADMSEAPVPMSSVVEIPIALGLRDGAVTVAWSAAAGPTHVLVLSIEKRTKRAGRSSRART
jgi:hypothetical protein